MSRPEGLRTFMVTLVDGSEVAVFAHRHENGNPAGHLNFMIAQSGGYSIINRSFHSDI